MLGGALAKVAVVGESVNVNLYCRGATTGACPILLVLQGVGPYHKPIKRLEAEIEGEQKKIKELIGKDALRLAADVVNQSACPNLHHAILAMFLLQALSTATRGSPRPANGT